MRLKMLVLPALFSLTLVAHSQEVPRGIGQWQASLGNERAVVYVSSKADAVHVEIPWRRRDDPNSKGIRIIAATGQETHNIAAYFVNQEEGNLAFQPVAGPGTYYVYYEPFETTGSPYFPVVTYPPFVNRPDPAWTSRNSVFLTNGFNHLPAAHVERIEARGEFNRSDPMEVIATDEEAKTLLANQPHKSFLLFPEDRSHPIKMVHHLPERWIQQPFTNTFASDAERNEFLSFQVGVWAAQAPLENVQVSFGDLRDRTGERIRATAFRCFNLGGVDWLGRRFTKRLDVAKGAIQPLWIGVDLKTDTRPGLYSGALKVGAANEPAQTVDLRIKVTPTLATDHGDGNPYHMSRLRWLDSKIGLDDDVVKPYTPLKVRGNTVDCLLRRVTFGRDGFPSSIVSCGNELLSRPISLRVDLNRAAQSSASSDWEAENNRVLLRKPGAISRETTDRAYGLHMVCDSKMEADGYINYRVALTATKPIDVSNIHLDIPIRKERATYLMGMGRKGGYRPDSWYWNWNRGYANNMIWTGDVQGGLQLKLKGIKDTWDLFRLSEIPDAWSNGGKGDCLVQTQDKNTVLIRAECGPRTIQKGQTLHFNFGLLITPVKPLDSAHWSQRYDHEYISPEKAKTNGATVINIHQGNELNPYINYPFLTDDKLGAYVSKAHALGMKVKIYYTVRELSNRVAEMWALRSLGTEVFQDGPGGGDSWLQEHLVSHYKPAWHTPLPDDEIDAAIATQGLSRWHNYYLEGLRWLISNVGIDGLYLDGIGYDREIMKRVRKVMDRTKSGCLIDFHSGNSFQPEYGMNSCANQYMDHFPYINSLWFGEGYDYNESADYWLVEISGIPFGLYGEMLQNNGNPWRGMVYGMTARYYSGAQPKPIWELWDQFGIAKSNMLGYWSPSCPVRTDDPSVLATAYVRKGKTLIALASWDKNPAQVHLKIDWKALGLDPSSASLVAPAISGFQAAARFKVRDAIPVEPGKGRMIVVSD